MTKRQYILALGVLLFLALLFLYLNREGMLTTILGQLKNFKTESDELRAAILAYGPYAPLFFIAIQIFQVILAPIPGEVSGLVGGYVFGTWPCFLYSTIGLTIGSLIAFGGGRLLGSFLTDRFRHTRFYRSFNHLICRGDYLIPFILFILPGFPKDSLSYLLGMSSMPLPIFIFVAGVGRMPGTLLLSANGAEAYSGDWLKLALLFILSAVLVIPAMLYRHRLLEKIRHHRQAKTGPTERGDCETP
ncbi:MAG: TVP38/TMEM64 family protein [Desulfobulbales bacterium]|nr:TVP38/TMEM64 family protein [Desulfobulbales bacterium]